MIIAVEFVAFLQKLVIQVCHMTTDAAAVAECLRWSGLSDADERARRGFAGELARLVICDGVGHEVEEGVSGEVSLFIWQGPMEGCLRSIDLRAKILGGFFSCRT